MPPERTFKFGEREVSAREMMRGLVFISHALTSYPDPVARTEALKQQFDLYQSRGSDNEGRVLFTGYYEPVLHASREPVPPYVYPLYEIPTDMVEVDRSAFGEDLPPKRLVGRVQGRKLVPYHERRDIDFKGALAGKAQPLAYLADPVEAFFFHIQGSGQVVFDDGTRLRLGYAATNGQPYRSIGKLLLDQGRMEMEEMSMQGIQQYLAEHPELLEEVLSHNPSYVFFRPLEAEGGPLGCFGVPLTAGRSIATDRKIFPGLAPAFIIGQRPAPGGQVIPFSRLVLNQDTGGAIKGPGRLDLYFGSGYEAGLLAGGMKYPGELFFLAPKANQP